MRTTGVRAAALLAAFALSAAYGAGGDIEGTVELSRVVAAQIAPGGTAAHEFRGQGVSAGSAVRVLIDTALRP